VNKSEFKETLLQAMKQAGMETELRNTVFHWVRSHSNHDSLSGYSFKEPLAYLRKAQVSHTNKCFILYKMFNLTLLVADVHKINSRQILDFHVPLVSLTKVQKGVYYSGITLFNSLPHNINQVAHNINSMV
jgi:hypothetical protein